MCLALVALALDLVWGYAGILSLGMVCTLPLGGYAFGMYLMREAAGDGLPDFMRFLSWTELPWYWMGTEHIVWALALVVLVPGLIAFIFGFFAFRSKIKGVYFSIITQAMTFAAALLFLHEPALAVTTALPVLKPILGMDITSALMRATSRFLTASDSAGPCFVGLRHLMNKPDGRVLVQL